MNLYKLMIFYEEYSVFELLYEDELALNLKTNIISSLFSYSILLNNPLIAICIRNKYISHMINDKDNIIDSLLNYLNEFTETNGSSQYM